MSFLSLKEDALRAKAAREAEIEENYKTLDRSHFNLHSIVEKLEKIKPPPIIALDGDGSCLNIHLSNSKDVFNGVFGMLRNMGYEPDDRPEKDQINFSTFWRKEGATKIWFSFNSTSCRRVKVGTRTVEQDVYEIVCGETNPNS